eukprot:gene12157-biopygen6026
MGSAKAPAPGPAPVSAKKASAKSAPKPGAKGSGAQPDRPAPYRHTVITGLRPTVIPSSRHHRPPTAAIIPPSPTAAIMPPSPSAAIRHAVTQPMASS